MEDHSGPTAARPDAFILAGAFRVVCRNHRYLTELAARGLAVLVLTPDTSRAQAEAVLGRPDAPALPIADVAYVSGAMDRESSYNPGVFAALQHWRERYRVVGAYAMEEMLVEPTGLVCDALGLPSPGLRASRVCRSKYLQRAFTADFGPASLTIPPGTRATAPLDSVKYPAVLKPAARHASSGVVACGGADEAAALLRAYPEHETVLLERKVEGQEFSVESLVQDGRVLFASLTRKETTDIATGTFVELSHTVPADTVRIGGTDITGTVLDANRRLLQALAYENGITHSEWRVTDTGEPYLMEIASRTPGDGITLLYELACGEPLETQIIRIALGEPAAYPRPRRHARQVYLDHHPGILRDVLLDWPGVAPHWLGPADLWPPVHPGLPGDAPALRAVLVLKERGSLLTPLRSSDDRAVTFLIDADTPRELDAIEARVRAALTLRTDPAPHHREPAPAALERTC